MLRWYTVLCDDIGNVEVTILSDQLFNNAFLDHGILCTRVDIDILFFDIAQIINL